MGSKFDRSAVVRWAAIKEGADGRERQAIEWMSEAFYPLANTESDRRWLSSFLSGIPALVEEARQTIKQDQTLALSDEQGPRIDAEQPSESVAEEEPINWATVASEVETMLAIDSRSPDASKD